MIPPPPRSTLFPYTTLFRSNLDVEARLSGALHHPDLAVRSNLDEAVASRLRAVLGEQVAAAEKQMRDRVDALINRSEEHTSELQSRENLVCRLLLEKKKDNS